MSYHKEYSGLGFGVFSCSMKSSLTVSFFPFSFLAFLSAQSQMQREKSSGRGRRRGRLFMGHFFFFRDNENHSEKPPGRSPPESH